VIVIDIDIGLPGWPVAKLVIADLSLRIAVPVTILRRSVIVGSPEDPIDPRTISLDQPRSSLQAIVDLQFWKVNLAPTPVSPVCTKIHTV
jgi:hypothetical protein